MKVLVAFECSGVVRRAFRSLGHDAWSLDLKPAEDGSRHHIQDNFWQHADNRAGYDMLIAHPDCTYVAGSGLHWNARGRLGPDGRPRQAWTDEAVEQFRTLLALPFPKIVAENPVGCLSTRVRRPDQIIQPYDFGDDASKRTCLWLINVPPLVVDEKIRKPGRLVEWPVGSGRMVERWANQTDSNQNRLAPSVTRAAQRSETYPGVAAAFASQWGGWAPHLMPVAELAGRYALSASEQVRMVAAMMALQGKEPVAEAVA